MREKLAHYQIVRLLGEGGMGVVYAARDERLGRMVAIKTIRESTSDTQARQRLWREARAAASVNHPNICQVYEVGEEDGELYITMELLEGSPLAARIAQGPLPPDEAIELALGILAALEALHQRDVIHRDLKPTNVFLTPHGVKLLDFGLARPVRADLLHTDVRLTMPGVAVGTPRYMAPEQWTDVEAAPACDLFAAGALLFEMLTGKPAFGGQTLLEVYHAIVHEEPPALAGGQEVMALDRVLQRALAKRPQDRYPSAAAMADELRSVSRRLEFAPVRQVRAMKRLIVLPFRLLRPDPEIEFLSFSLPDAITVSLSGVDGLIVRSSATAARFAADSPDLKLIASEAGVDAVLCGTLLRARDQVRVTTQLVETPGGTLLCSRVSQVALRDIFQLQDEMAAQIVQSLAVPLGTPQPGGARSDLSRSPSGERPGDLAQEARRQRDSRRSLDPDGQRDSSEPLDPGRSQGPSHPPEGHPPEGAHLALPQRDVPASSKGYELYLRANQLAYNMRLLAEARDLYVGCLKEDPGYAPAWARLGRAYRVMAKYGHGEPDEYYRLAQEAFDRAFALNPDLTIAHNLYTNFEVEAGRATQSMVRLLARAAASPADPELFAGLVLTCRFCGLLQASVAADRRARRLDPGVRTSVAFTYWMLEDYPNAMHYDDEHERFVLHYSMPMIGREQEAIARYREQELSGTGLAGTIARATRAALEHNREECVEAVHVILGSGFRDPEGLMFAARGVARVGDAPLALDILGRVVAGGLFCARTLRTDPGLESLRGEARFAAITQRAEAGVREAAEAYERAGGERLLGMGAS
jgi:serine/threonine protein kinase